MGLSDLSIERIHARDVDTVLAQQLQQVAQEAWTSNLDGKRHPSEIARIFDPDNPVLVEAAEDQYRAFARHGQLIVATLTPGSAKDIIGFSMARNDVSPADGSAKSLAVRTGKRALAVAHNRLHLPTANAVYAWEKHLAVKSSAPLGTGTKLIDRTYREGFHPNQVATAYIDDENSASIKFFEGLTFSWDGIDEPPNTKIVYRYGRDNAPTIQRRYTTLVAALLGRTASTLTRISLS